MNKGLFWFFHIIAGVCLIILLGIHMILMHLDTIISIFTGNSYEPLNFSLVLYRGTNACHLIFYLLFLTIALYHGFYGLKNILVEIWHSLRAEATIKIFVVTFGIILWLIGTYTTVKFFVHFV